ncbi:MAG: hypothetical protein U9N56_10130 [Actinomycetota bacterium]|nr:hypothetical protein [Actinomycetota bacterium]
MVGFFLLIFYLVSLRACLNQAGRAGWMAHVLESGVAIIQTSLLPRILGWPGVGLAFNPLVLPPGMAGGGFFLSILAISTLFLVKARRAQHRPAHNPSPNRQLQMIAKAQVHYALRIRGRLGTLVGLSL